jgi:signal transduction histidine kinase
MAEATHGRPAAVVRPAWPRPRPLRHRLSQRLACLMVAAVLVMQALVFLPSLVRSRQVWLERRITEARLAALSAAAAPDGKVDWTIRDDLLRLAGADAIWLREPGRTVTVLPPRTDLPDAVPEDLRSESVFDELGDAVAGLFPRADRLIGFTATGDVNAGSTITVVLHRAALDHSLIGHARRVGGVSLLIATAAGVVLYLWLQMLLVRPLRRLTESIAAFRADPERSTPLDPVLHTTRHGGEIAEAAVELAAMQQELRAALWRNARLAALGTAMAKVSHDLRGILSPALLTAERLQMSADPPVKRAGDILVRAVERATELASRTLEFARETPIALPKARIRLHSVVEEAADQVRTPGSRFVVDNTVSGNIEVEADRQSLVRVLANLLRNACEADARTASVCADYEGGAYVVTVTDDGPGLPDNVRAALYRPFTSGGRRSGTGLGLAIVRDLMRAHGGDVTLVATGPTGTSFRLTLPGRRPAGAATTAAQAAVAGR